MTIPLLKRGNLDTDRQREDVMKREPKTLIYKRRNA